MNIASSANPSKYQGRAVEINERNQTLCCWLWIKNKSKLNPNEKCKLISGTCLIFKKTALHFQEWGRGG
jgi:hypothetical protein